MDNVSTEVRKKTMQSIKSRGTKLETKTMRALWAYNIRYRKNVKDLAGHPDISIKSKKTVVFIDSCYWHGCPIHCRMPHSNEDYWDKKIERNIARDKGINKHYIENGWNCIRVWEHELRENFESTIVRIAGIIKS